MKNSYFAATLFLLINISPFLYSQDHLFERGTVITATDTFQGFLKRATDLNLTHSVEFKTDSNATSVKIFKPENTSSFTFDADKATYGKVQIGFSNNEKYISEWRFGRLILKGATTVYKLRLGSIEKKVILEQKCSDLYIVLQKDIFYTLEMKESLEKNIYDLTERNMYHLKKRYIPVLQYITRDCPQISRKAENVSFTEKAMADYFSEYNNCVNPSEQTIVYKTRSKKIIGQGVEASSTLKPTGLLALGYFIDAREPNLSERIHATVGLHLIHLTFNNTGSTGVRLKVMGNYDLIFKKSQQFYYGLGYEFMNIFEEVEFSNGTFVKNDLVGLFNTNVGYRNHNFRLELGYEIWLADLKVTFLNLTMGWYLHNTSSKKQ